MDEFEFAFTGRISELLPAEQALCAPVPQSTWKRGSRRNTESGRPMATSTIWSALSGTGGSVAARGP